MSQNESNAFPKIEMLVPHRATMCLLDRMTDMTPREATAEAVIPENSVFLENGRLINSVLIEYMAQTIAGFLGYRYLSGDEEPRMGYLVGISKCTIENISIKAGDRLTVHVKEEGILNNYGIFKGEVHCGSSLVCKGTLKVYSDKGEK
jgi:predicted hotdog family 3-hydroxylacyl-ACP dehydratase